MQTSAKVIEDSISKNGHRITTLQLVYPRFIHSEFMTHRAFSRNSMSSRAIPVAKMIEQVRNDPAMPTHWGKNQPGMQAREELGEDDIVAARSQWRRAAIDAADRAENLSDLGAHKQIVNRILEPFQWMHTIVTATDWMNFFGLRDHPDAMPEMAELARCIRDARDESGPKMLVDGEWHLPFVSTDQALMESDYPYSVLCKASAARCARVSYLNHDGTAPTIEKDIELANRLASSVPIHASPFEHQATPIGHGMRNRNFTGWMQHRVVIEASML